MKREFLGKPCNVMQTKTNEFTVLY